MSEVFVGIDVAKDSSNGHGLNAKGETLFSISFPMNREGFSKLLDELKNTSRDLSEVLVAMESTACYHINLFSWLTANGVNAVVINPLLISNFARLSLRKTKTDKKDAGTIAQFAMIHKDSISQLSVTQDLQDLRDLARESESLCQLIFINKTEIKRLLQTLFPELETICDPSTKVMLDFLQEFPSARIVAAAKPKTMAKVLNRKGVGTRLTYTAADLIQAAQNSVATVSPAKELILRGKIAMIKLHMDQPMKHSRLWQKVSFCCRCKPGYYRMWQSTCYCIFDCSRVLHSPRCIQYFYTHNVSIFIEIKNYSGLFLVALLNRHTAENDAHNINFRVISDFHFCLQYLRILLVL